MSNKLEIRIDRWLWFVRIFKTRSLATTACLGGKVKIGNTVVKPSREVKVDDIFHISLHNLTKSVKVLNAPNQRIGGKFVHLYYEDMTPADEYEKLKRKSEQFEHRQRGSGRPTKRERRQIDFLKENYPFNS